MGAAQSVRLNLLLSTELGHTPSRQVDRPEIGKPLRKSMPFNRPKCLADHPSIPFERMLLFKNKVFSHIQTIFLYPNLIPDYLQAAVSTAELVELDVSMSR